MAKKTIPTQEKEQNKESPRVDRFCDSKGWTITYPDEDKKKAKDGEGKK